MSDVQAGPSALRLVAQVHGSIEASAVATMDREAPADYACQAGTTFRSAGAWRWDSAPVSQSAAVQCLTVTTPPAIEPDAIQSLDAIRAELDAQIGDVARRAAALDTKAAMVLAAGGILVKLNPSNPTAVDTIAVVIAAIAGVVAVWAASPRMVSALDPGKVRGRYLHQPPNVTALVLLDTRMALYEKSEQDVARKWARLRVAMIVLAFSIVLSAFAAVLRASSDQSSAVQERVVPPVSTSVPSSVESPDGASHSSSPVMITTRSSP